MIPAITYFRAGEHYHRLQELNGRVRNGNVCFLLDMVTGNDSSGRSSPNEPVPKDYVNWWQ